MLGFQARKETVIGVRPQLIFDIVSDLSRHPELAGSEEVLQVRKLTEGPVRPGTQFEADEDIRIGPRREKFVSRSEVVVYDPPHSISWTSTPPLRPAPRRIQWWFRLRQQDGRTHVVHQVEVDFGPALNIVFKLPYQRLRGETISRGMDKTLTKLAQLADEAAATTR